MTNGVLVPQFKTVHVRHEGTTVLIIQDGKALLELPYGAALELANAIRAKAKQAEELAHAESVITDQAILLRSGVPVGLATRPDMIQEAVKEAAWNTALRRYMPVSKQAQAGTVFPPRVVRHKK